MPSKSVSAVLLVLSLGCAASESSIADTFASELPTRTDCTPAAPCATCDPVGTGTGVGDVIADGSFDTDAGGSLRLHTYCGVRKGVLLIETASWCTLCTERLPLMHQWFAQYQPLGVEVVFLVGENRDGKLPTRADLQRYRTDHTLDASLQVVGDPKWTKIKELVRHSAGIGSLPEFVLLDSALRLVYAGDGGDKALFPQVSAALGELTGSPFVAKAECAGFCGRLAPGGCWCDDLCAQLGNCCEDNCGVCGYCD